MFLTSTLVLCQYQQSIPVLQEMITVVLVYWEKNCAWVEQEQRFDESFFPSLKLTLFICEILSAYTRDSNYSSSPSASHALAWKSSQSPSKQFLVNQISVVWS